MAERKKRLTRTLVIDQDSFEALQAKALDLGLAFKSPRVVLRYVLGLEKLPPKPRASKAKDEAEKEDVGC